MSDWEEEPDYDTRRINTSQVWKPFKNYKFEHTIDLPKELIGRMIGRSGNNIHKLECRFRVSIFVDKIRKVVRVSANNEDTVNKAVTCIKEQLHDFANDKSRYDNHDSRYNVKKLSSQSNSSCNNEIALIDWSAINQRSEETRKEKWAKCPQLIKNFYKENPLVANLTDEEVARIRSENNNITVSRVFDNNDGDTKDFELKPIPNPVWEFEHCFAEYPDLLTELYKQGFKKPSPIQLQAWPILLQGEDLIGIAQTGTGKTLAFILPALIHVEYQSIPRSERGGPNVLVLAPTRELALQIEKEINKYSFRGIKAACIYGGGNRNEQIRTLEKGVEIIICTPGRLNDLIESQYINVSTITYLILDEADRMLDMGFEPQIRKVLLDIRPDRQTVMTSATWPSNVRRLAQSYMNNPIQIIVGSLDLAATHTVHQIIEILDENDKFDMLKSFARSMKSSEKVIIFCSRKARVDDLSSEFAIRGIPCECIHGSHNQSDREQAIADITSGVVKILIATDVASRGLDIDDVTHVINFDFPQNIEEYVHRLGRTGRAGRTGTCITYMTRDNCDLASKLIPILQEAEQEIPFELKQMAERYAKIKEKRNDVFDKSKHFRSKGYNKYNNFRRF